MDQVKGQEIIETPLEFNQRAGLGFKNLALLTRVLTHRSYINENPDALEDNERLDLKWVNKNRIEVVKPSVFSSAAYKYYILPIILERNPIQRLILKCIDTLI